MNEAIERLDTVRMNFGVAKSLVAFTGDYFRDDKPDSSALLCRYKMYSDINHAAHDMIFDNLNALGAALDELRTIVKAVGA